MHWFGDGMWFGWIFMVLFWALIIAGIVVVVRWITTQNRPPASHSEESALDILKKRYAKGDISKEEYEEKRKQLLS
jgi:putative membrane protein